MPLNLGYGAAWGTAVQAPGPALPSDLDLGAVRVTKRSAKTRRPELMLSRGPVVLGQPGQSWNDLLGSRYALALLATGALALYQLDADWQPGTGWQRVPDDAADLPALPGGARHLGFCFDQSGNPVICWEVSGQVFVRQFDPGSRAYVVRGPFEGHDPLLSFDALHSGQIPGSDVALFVLSAERTRLDSRLQRDLYRVTYPVAVFETPALLDQAVSLPYRLELLGEVGGAELALLSGLYPVPVADQAQASVSGMTTGALVSIVDVYSVSDAAQVGVSAMTEGVFLALVDVKQVADTAQVGLNAMSTGVFLALVEVKQVADAAQVGLSAMSTGVLAQVVTVYTAGNEVTAGLTAMTGGTYE